MSTKEWRIKNIDKVRAYRRKWYSKNKKHAKQKARERVDDIKQWIRDIKASLKCNRCSENDPSCLSFHHKNPKEKDITIARAAVTGWSKKKILEEIKKCEILCANCHMKEHHKHLYK